MADRTFRLKVREVHIQDYLVKAETPEKAIKKLVEERRFNDNGDDVLLDEGNFEFSHRLDREHITFSEEKG